MKQEYLPMSKLALAAIKPGDIVERMLAFCIPNYLIVGEVDDKLIYIGKKGDGGWKFDRETGVEIDEDIPTAVSYIKRVVSQQEADEAIKQNNLKHTE